MDFSIKSFVYRQPPAPPRIRTKPMRLLCLGLSRSATESLSTALRQLGYTVYHTWDMINEKPNRCRQWTVLARQKYGDYYPSGYDDHHCGRSTITAEQFDELLGHADVVIDLVAYVFAGELIEAYPDAKVIMNQRSDLDAWAKSLDKTLIKIANDRMYQFMSKFSPFFFWLRELVFHQTLPFFYRSDNAGFGMQHCGKWVYKEHGDMVRGALARRGELESRYLEWAVEDGWEPLCQFIGKDVPKGDFPRSNDANAFSIKRDGIIAYALKEAVPNMIICLCLLVGLTVFIVQSIKDQRPFSP